MVPSNAEITPDLVEWLVADPQVDVVCLFVCLFVLFCFVCLFILLSGWSLILRLILLKKKRLSSHHVNHKRLCEICYYRVQDLVEYVRGGICLVK